MSCGCICMIRRFAAGDPEAYSNDDHCRYHCDDNYFLLFHAYDLLMLV